MSEIFALKKNIWSKRRCAYALNVNNYLYIMLHHVCRLWNE